MFSSVAQLCLTLCDPMDYTMSGLPDTNTRSLLKLMSIESVIPSNHLILCRPLLTLPSIFPSIRVFSNESALHIRWPKYWSFSFNISPSSEGIIHVDVVQSNLLLGCDGTTTLLGIRVPEMQSLPFSYSVLLFYWNRNCSPVIDI